MSDDTKIKQFVYDRDTALSNMDTDWVRATSKSLKDASDLVVLMTIHKARYEATGIEASLRHESRRWLQRRGLRRLVGKFLPDDQLP